MVIVTHKDKYISGKIRGCGSLFEPQPLITFKDAFFDKLHINKVFSLCNYEKMEFFFEKIEQIIAFLSNFVYTIIVKLYLRVEYEIMEE